MKTKNFFYVIGLAILLGACASENSDQNDLGYPVVENPEYGEFQDMETPAFEFVLYDSTVLDLPNDFIVSTISSINKDTAGNIFFMENRQHKLISFSPNLEFRWMTGGEGRGPGDFENARTMINDGNHLVVGNLGGNRIDLFDFDGNFIRSYNLSKEISRMSFRGVTDDGYLIGISSVFEMLGKQIHVINLHRDSLEVINSFTIDETGGRYVPPGVTTHSPTSVRGNYITSGSINDYSVTFYNIDGEIEKKYLRDVDLVLGPGIYSTGTRRGIRFFGEVSAPEYLPDNTFYVTAMWSTNIDDPDEYIRKSMDGGNVPEVESRNTMDFYDEDGKLLYSMEAEGANLEIGRILHVDEEGLIYTFQSDPEPVIYRYKIQSRV